MAEQHPDVELRVPADAAYANVLRTAAAGLAARVDFSIDDVEDLRAAVDEACALMVPVARDGSTLDCSFWLEEDGISFVVTGALAHSGIDIRRGGFGWQVLEALTDRAVFDEVDGAATISLTRRRRAPVETPGGIPRPA